jgi:hypothetical protein
MRSVWVWLILAIPAAWAVWQLQVPEPVLAPGLLGLMLLTLGLLAGLRIANDGLHRFFTDLTRLNKYLADQNDDLAELNLHLLQELQKHTTDEASATSGEEQT